MKYVDDSLVDRAKKLRSRDPKHLDMNHNGLGRRT